MAWYFSFFVVSGFCSLVYEVVWLRLAMAAFGVTTPFVSIVLSVFMAGLALGSWAAGRLTGKLGVIPPRAALRLYAVVEAIIGAILKGQRDPYQLADLRDKRVRASREQVALSLEGNWREDVLFELQQAVDSYEFAHRQMGECDRKLEGYLASLPARVVEVAEPPKEAEAVSPQKGQKTKKGKKASTATKATKPKGNAPAFDLKAELQRICGVDLTSIDGISVKFEEKRAVLEMSSLQARARARGFKLIPLGGAQ